MCGVCEYASATVTYPAYLLTVLLMFGKARDVEENEENVATPSTHLEFTKI